MLNEVVSTIATLGYNVETIEHKSLNLTVWDLAGQERIRGLWRPFFTKCSAIVFVVDSSDRARVAEAEEELEKLLKEEDLKQCPLLIYATKQDCESPMDIPELSDALGLHDIRDRPWFIQPTKTIEGVGIFEGLDWLANRITEKKSSPKISSTSSPLSSPVAATPKTKSIHARVMGHRVVGGKPAQLKA
eukprot:gene11526-13451_t